MSSQEPLGKPLEPPITETLEAHPSPSTTEPKASQPKARRPTAGEPSLLELEKDFDVLLHDSALSADKARTYRRTRRLTLRRKTNRIPIKKIKRKIAKLRKRYPDKGYYAEKVKLGKLALWKIGRKAEGERDVPLFYSTSRGRFYVSASDVRRNRRLASTVVMYRLSGLGVPYSLSLVREKRLEEGGE